MLADLKWQDIYSDNLVADFAVKNNLSVDLLTRAKQVLILPSNNNFTKLPEQHLFSAYAKEVLFVLKESGVDVSFYEDERPRRELVLKHATVFLPIIYWIGPAVSGVVLGVISNWIYDRFVKNNPKEPLAIIRYEDAELKPDGHIRFRRLEGPADKVSKILAAESKALEEGKIDSAPTTPITPTKTIAQCQTDKKVTQKKRSRKPRS